MRRKRGRQKKRIERKEGEQEEEKKAKKDRENTFIIRRLKNVSYMMVSLGVLRMHLSVTEDNK